MCSSSPLVVSSNRNPYEERFFRAEATISVLQQQFTISSLQSMVDGDRFFILTSNLKKNMCNKQQGGDVDA